MPSRPKNPPADPGAVLRRQVEETRDMVARLEAENVQAAQAEEAALEQGDTGAIVAARGRAGAVADALTRQRQRVVNLEASLEPLERVEAEEAAIRRMVEQLNTASTECTQYETVVAAGADALTAVGKKGLAARRRYFEALQAIYTEAMQLGVTLRWYRFEDRAPADDLVEKLREAGGDVVHLHNATNAHAGTGWQNRHLPPLGVLIERVIDGLALEQAEADSRARRETERQEAANVA